MYIAEWRRNIRLLSWTIYLIGRLVIASPTSRGKELQERHEEPGNDCPDCHCASLIAKSRTSKLDQLQKSSNQSGGSVQPLRPNRGVPEQPL